MEQHLSISKYASILYRLSQPFFDGILEPFGIGCGQQFFLMRVAEFPGLSQQELAQKGYYDPGTTARAVKKLEELGLIERRVDPADKRLHQLFLTERGAPVLEATLDAIEHWHEILVEGFTEEEINTVQKLMGRMSENAYRCVQTWRKTGKEWNK